MKLNCPQCGDENKIAVPEAFLTCQSCKSSLFIDIDKIAVVYTFTPTVKPEVLSLYLKKDFDKVGFDENINITRSIPIYLPFHQVKGQNLLRRASSHFPEDSIPLPSSQKMVFHPAGVEAKHIEIYDIDTQPPGSEEEILFYLPSICATIRHKRKNCSAYLVHGRPDGKTTRNHSTRDSIQ